MAWMLTCPAIQGARCSAEATAALGESTKMCKGSLASVAAATSSMIAPGAS